MTNWKAGKNRSDSPSATSTRSSICSTDTPPAPRTSRVWRNIGVPSSDDRSKCPSHIFSFSSASSRSEEHTSELQSLMRNSYAVFCLKKKISEHNNHTLTQPHHNPYATHTHTLYNNNT